MSYSQGQEEAIIMAHFIGRKGRFLDIGANDGETFSNTRALALAGWYGTLVEPNSEAFARLEQVYIASTGLKLINAAITDHDGMVTMHMASDSLVSSLDALAEATWRHHGFEWKPEQVQGMTVTTLLEMAPGPYNLISIDAEGHDWPILKQMDLRTMKCEMLVIEHGAEWARIDRYMKAAGYKRIHRDGINSIYIA